MSSVTISQRSSDALPSIAPRPFGKLWPLLRFALNGFIVAQLFCVASSIAAISFMQNLGADDPLPPRLQSAEAFVNLHQGAALFVTGVFTLAAAVAYCRFYYRALTNLRLAEAKGADASPAWTIGAHFIPVVNLWKPFASMKKVWIGSHDPQSAKGETPWTILWWWAASLAAGAFAAGSLVAAWNAGFYGYGITDRMLYVDSLTLKVVSSVLFIIAAALVLEFSAHIRLAQHAKVLPAGQRLMFRQ